jgi:hypothetical protein
VQYTHMYVRVRLETWRQRKMFSTSMNRVDRLRGTVMYAHREGGAYGCLKLGTDLDMVRKMHHKLLNCHFEYTRERALCHRE